MVASPVKVGLVSSEDVCEKAPRSLPPGLLEGPAGCTESVPAVRGPVSSSASLAEVKLQPRQPHPAEKSPSPTCQPQQHQHLAPNKQQTPKEKPLQSGSTRDVRDNDITTVEPPWTTVTTVILRNLPNRYDRPLLLKELLENGFTWPADFDFLYLPMDHSRSANLGYCFINFVQTPIANAFANKFAGKRMRRFNSQKTASVMPASIQGYDRNFKHYFSTNVMKRKDPLHRPLFARLATDMPGVPTSQPSLSECSRRDSVPKSVHDDAGLPGCSSSHSKGSASSTDAQGTQRTSSSSPSTGGNTSPPGLDTPPTQPMKVEVKQACRSCGAEWGNHCRFCARCGGKLTQVTGGVDAKQPPVDSTLHRSPMSGAPGLLPSRADGGLGGSGRGQPGMPLTTDFLPLAPRGQRQQRARDTSRLADDAALWQWHGRQQPQPQPQPQRQQPQSRPQHQRQPQPQPHQQQNLAKLLGEWGFEGPERNENHGPSDRTGQWAQRYQDEMAELRHRLACLEAGLSRGGEERLSV